MLYLCLPSYNEAPTVGLLLWKIRKTFATFPREYQLLVGDDGSTDATTELLEPYAKVLPLTVVRHPERQGYARCLEALLRLAVERTDRPRRDAAIMMSADFTHDPAFLPEIVRRLESGADVVVGEGRIVGATPPGYRITRWGARWLLRGLRVPGVSDVVSGLVGYRLIVLRNAFRSGPGPLLTAEGWAANAELLARAARHARRVETVPVLERHDRRPRASRVRPWSLARDLWREGGRLHLRPESPWDPSRPAVSPTEENEQEEAAR